MLDIPYVCTQVKHGHSVKETKEKLVAEIKFLRRAQGCPSYIGKEMKN